MLDCREKLTPCALRSFEVVSRNYGYKMKHIKNEQRKSIRLNMTISHTISTHFQILFETALKKLSQATRDTFHRPSHLTVIIHTHVLKPSLDLELFVFSQYLLTFQLTQLNYKLQYPPYESPPSREHPLADGCPRYNAAPAAPLHRYNLPSIPSPLTPNGRTSRGTCQSNQGQRQREPEPEYSSQTTKHAVPVLGRNLRGRAWEQIVEDWDNPDPSRSLFVAMKNWNSNFFQSKAEEVKFGQRQVIALEFINV